MSVSSLADKLCHFSSEKLLKQKPVMQLERAGNWEWSQVKGLVVMKLRLLAAIAFSPAL